MSSDDDLAHLLELLPLAGDDELFEPEELERVRELIAEDERYAKHTEEYSVAYGRLAAAQEEAMQPLPDAVRERVLSKLEGKLKTTDAPPSFDREKVEALRSQIALSCSYCHDDLERDASVFCASCLAPHHRECFSEHGGCSMPGCNETRAVQPAELGPASTPSGDTRKRGIVISLIGLIAGGGLAALAAYDRPGASGGAPVVFEVTDDDPVAAVDEGEGITEFPEDAFEGEEATFPGDDPFEEEEATLPPDVDLGVQEDPQLAEGGFEVRKLPDGRLRVCAVEAPLKKLVAEVARVGGVNAVVDPFVDERVTLAVTVEQPRAALKIIADLEQAQHEVLPGGVSWIEQPPRISLTLQQADVQALLRLLGMFSGKNVIVDPAVSGTMNADFHEVDWREALRAITRSTNSYAYPLGDDTVLVTHAELPDEVVRGLRPDYLQTDLGGFVTDARINIDVEEVDLKQVCAVLAKHADLMLITDPALNEQVSLSLRDVPWETALLVLQKLTRCEVSVKNAATILFAPRPGMSLQAERCSAATVYRLLAQQGGLNVVYSQSLAGQISVDLKGLTPLATLRALAAVQGHKVTFDGDVISVGAGHWDAVAAPAPRESSERERAITALLDEVASLAQTGDADALRAKQRELAALVEGDAQVSSPEELEAARAAIQQQLDGFVAVAGGKDAFLKLSPEEQEAALKGKKLQQAIARYFELEPRLEQREAQLETWFAQLSKVPETLGDMHRLSVSIGLANDSMRAIQKAIREERPREALRHADDVALLIVRSLRSGEGAVFTNNAKALEDRVRKLRGTAEALLQLDLVGGRLEAVLLDNLFEARPLAAVSGEMLGVGNIFGDERFKVVSIEANKIELEHLPTSTRFVRTLRE